MSEINLVPFSESETDLLKKLYPNTVGKEGLRFVRTQPGNYVLPSGYSKFKDQFANFNIQTDDKFVITFPKNGTTWVQELVWCVCNGVDIEKAKSFSPLERVPFLEFPALADHSGIRDKLLPPDPVAMMESMPAPRIFRSHLPWCLLPHDLLEKSKVVSCLRNPKDTVVSYYHHQKLTALQGYDVDGDFASFFDIFMDNMVLYSSYFDYVTEIWKRRNHPNLCILFFEDMKKDLFGSIKKVAEFLDKEIKEELISRLVDHLSFKNMKKNHAEMESALKKLGRINDTKGCFFRKGEVGYWKNYFTDEMNRRMDEAIERHLKPTGLEFRYE